MTNIHQQIPEAHKVNNFIVEALTIALLGLSGLLSMIAIATA